MNKHNSISRIKKSPMGRTVAKRSSTQSFRGLLLLSLMSVLWIGCKEEGRIDYFDDSGPAPAQIEKNSITVFDFAGGSVLKYKVPSDKNLLCVRAEYEIQPGVIRETKSSFYKDSLVLEGFGEARTYDVKLFSIGKNGKASEPLTVQINPKTPPVILAGKILKEAFGGVAITVNNPYQANLAVVLMGDTAKNGYQTTLQTFYTSKEKASFNFRGLDTIPGNFSVYLRDRWGNLSDTVKASLTPLFEQEIPYTKWAEYTLPGDVTEFYLNLSAKYMWNNNWTDTNQACISAELPFPQILTFDLGEAIVMSRFEYWPRATAYDIFTRGHPKIFELWGSMEPNKNGDLDDTWIPLGRFETENPLGLTPAEGVGYYRYPSPGFEFEMEVNDFSSDPFVPVRYIRIRTISTFGSTVKLNAMYQGIKIYGAIVN